MVLRDIDVFKGKVMINKKECLKGIRWIRFFPKEVFMDLSIYVQIQGIWAINNSDEIPVVIALNCTNWI